MDSIFAIIALIAFYAIQALAAKRKRGEGEPVEVSGELDDALAEIREVLGMGDEALPAEPKPAPPVVVREKPIAQTSDEFHRVVTGEVDLEERFERQKSEWRPAIAPTPAPMPSARPKKRPAKGAPPKRPWREFKDPLAGHDHRPRAAEELPPAAPVPRMLDTPDSIRQAIVLSEIIGPPKALRGRRR